MQYFIMNKFLKFNGKPIKHMKNENHIDSTKHLVVIDIMCLKNENMLNMIIFFQHQK